MYFYSTLYYAIFLQCYYSVQCLIQPLTVACLQMPHQTASQEDQSVPQDRFAVWTTTVTTSASLLQGLMVSFIA